MAAPKERADLPVVAASRAATTQATEAALRAGPSRVLLKPFTAEAVTAAIDNALNWRSGQTAR